MERRSFFTVAAGALAAIFMPWRKKAKSSNAATRAALDSVKMERDRLRQQVDASDDVPEHLKDHRFVVVHGGTLPNQYQFPCVREARTGNVTSDKGPYRPEPKTAVYENLPEMTGAPDDIYPRANRFQVMCVVSLGTIDELVAEYREGLTAAAKASTLHISGTKEELQEVQRQLNQKYPRTGEAVRINADYRNQQMFDGQRHQMESGKDFHNAKRT